MFRDFFSSFSKVLEQKEQLEQKHLHLLQILDSERQAKWHYVQQTEELAAEVKKLKDEVQSFFRGWLCRRRWKQIVDEYIRSDHAESMRKRNSIMFGMVECEEEYVKQLSGLVTVFLRPLRMAASSKKPPITHEDVNSIFLNRNVAFLPYKYGIQFSHDLSSNVALIYGGNDLDPCKHGLASGARGIPRYIITIHELLAHTPHDHVERKSLEFAQSKLEELSQSMQDEVSETENIRKNLAIERMIVEG
ncbi:hypothetical protein LSH36_58g06024, partial [Paralvinella palmiformis]